jgi:DNA-nicking Smr family endonuclease
MDFGNILDNWEHEKRKKIRVDKKNAMNELVDRFSPRDRDIREKEKTENECLEVARAKRKELLGMKPERTIDLHGLRADEAIKRVDAFLRKCRSEKVKKVLIIHGKGLHSDAIPVLGKKIVQYVQQCRIAGEYGVAPKEWGGRGALWVIIR